MSYHFFQKYLKKLWPLMLLTSLKIIICSININLDFGKKHSTSQAIITLVEGVSKALDTGKYVVGVFLDLKKTFDTVNHSILLNKLYLYGIRGNIIGSRVI